MTKQLFIQRPVPQPPKPAPTKRPGEPRRPRIRLTAERGSNDAYYPEDVAILMSEYESLGVYFGD
jgi:hypothetical protein